MYSLFLKKRRTLYFLSVALPWLLLTLPLTVTFAQESYRVNSDDVNVRADSTVSAAVICKINRTEQVEVIREFYDWFKIRLPKNAAIFVRKDLVRLLNKNTACVIGDNVNLRISSSEKSPVIGKANKGENIAILKKEGGWYQIAPTQNSFGWVYKKFIDKVNLPATPGKETKTTTNKES